MQAGVPADPRRGGRAVGILLATRAGLIGPGRALALGVAAVVAVLVVPQAPGHVAHGVHVNAADRLLLRQSGTLAAKYSTNGIGTEVLLSCRKRCSTPTSVKPSFT